MRLTVYKGFAPDELKRLKQKPLAENDIYRRLNVLEYDRNIRKQLNMALLSLEDKDDVWATYEEYTLIKNSVEEAVREDGLELLILRNNLYPEYYPLTFELSEELRQEITGHIQGNVTGEPGQACGRYLAVYNSLVETDGICYGGFYNFEYDYDQEKEGTVRVRDFYPRESGAEERTPEESREEDFPGPGRKQKRRRSGKSVLGRKGRKLPKDEQVQGELSGPQAVSDTEVLFKPETAGKECPEDGPLQEEIFSGPQEDLRREEYTLFINEDMDAYLRDFTRIRSLKPGVIRCRTTNSIVSRRIWQSLQAYCTAEKIRLLESEERLPETDGLEEELTDIARNEIGIRNFKGFRLIKFYKNPDMDKEVVEISQSRLIREIIRQAENSYGTGEEKSFRDIFITASTGAGKSVIFQIPAVYLAKKYGKLTIIIEPVKALMQDQKERLKRNGYTRAETFNSDLISQVEKEAVLKRIWEGEVDLLYLSPETLLSYSVESIIGDREIGLLIVDEAHIVTTWGEGFRPDYWYLGGYINRLRNRIQTTAGGKRRVYRFPVCAFTATAVNGGPDDSVGDTIISLYMENPLKYIGYVRRDDIRFNIIKKSTGRLSKGEYEQAKTKDLEEHLRVWLQKNEKTIVYFPYASYAVNAARGVRGFAGILCDKRIGVYTGRNVDEVSAESFNDRKRETFENFRRGKMPVVYATKAFGMGVDVDDVKNIYHYAVTGNLCDYVQEVGRAARKPGMEGTAVTDYYPNDLSFMRVLFGMSQIRQYQIRKVLEGIYDTYRSKKGARNFLVSPESFTYIFNGGVKDEGECINKLKTCLLMLEKDFYDKYNFKVMIARPQSVFTRAFVVVNKAGESAVLHSPYGKYFKFIAKGRQEERQADDSMLSDTGDIFSVDLKGIWEEFYPKISFPQFKYWYFHSYSPARNGEKTEVMPSVRDYFSPRQRLTVESRGDHALCDLRDMLLEDFEYIANTLYASYRKQYFTGEDFAKLIKEKYGMAQSRIIAHSLFELADPEGRCVKHRTGDASGQISYFLANGNFREYMRRPVIKSRLMGNLSRVKEAEYFSYISLAADANSNLALKLLSVFGYINYEIVGGEEPEIFIRLNDPEKIKRIVMGNAFYSNGYVTRAREKHERDMAVLRKFFNSLTTNEERWDFIEDYFLGGDVVETG